MKLTILLLSLPTLAAAQVTSDVEPILSQDYMKQVKKLQSRIDLVDSFSNSRNKTMKLKGQFNPSLSIKHIKQSDSLVQIFHQYNRYLTLSTTYTTNVEVRTHNRLPSLQTEYVQGRSVNGATIWRGPETGEMFSYGPGIHSLEFDGSSYPYDQNGRPVPSGTGNGKALTAYNNSIFQPAVTNSHHLSIAGDFIRYGKRRWNLRLTLGHRNLNTIIKEQKNTSRTLGADIGTSIKWLSVKSSYLYAHNELTNSNRNGFINRAYQNALLTPVSFSNLQGSVMGNGQRSYSSEADNPWFLLKDNNNHYHITQQNGTLALKVTTHDLTANVVQSLQHIQENTTETYKPGTATWINGMFTERNKRDLNYLLQMQSTYDIPYYDHRFNTKLGLSYTYNNANTHVMYNQYSGLYKYQRSTHEPILSANGEYAHRHIKVKLNAANKIYHSNTAAQNGFLLPDIDATLTMENIFSAFNMTLSSSYHAINSELPIDKSLAYTSLLQYTPGGVFNYRPTTEVTSYKNISPIDHREWRASFHLYYKWRLLLSGNTYMRNMRKDIFPVYRNNELVLRNMADLRNKGLQLSLDMYETQLTEKTSVSAALSFFTYRNIVTRVDEGENFTPIAGFRNIHKALVQGQPVGVIIGNTYLRDATGNIMIGDDGFPLTDNTPKIVGNPTPDFIMKLSNTLRWRKLQLNVNWEWKKGGETWNGTQAVLDYYGRSATTSLQRNINNYVFDGVRTDGHMNDISVSFYDPSLPVTSNRWTRYSLTGVTEAYIQKTDYLRLNDVTISYRLPVIHYTRLITLSMYVNNILLWSPYKGADPDQLLLDQPNTTGLDFFNLPAVKTYGFNVSFQF